MHAHTHAYNYITNQKHRYKHEFEDHILPVESIANSLIKVYTMLKVRFSSYIAIACLLVLGRSSSPIACVLASS